MSAKYLIRLDDACPEMDRQKWTKIEAILDAHKIKPIVAVIPNNKNQQLNKDKPDLNFWDKVKRWETKGWAIALHGYDHVYITKERGLVSTNKKSEFAGVEYSVQKEKIINAWKIFVNQNIFPKIWVAPAHTFDDNTLKALKEFTDISIISDGVSVYPYQEKNFTWLPQQLWRLRWFPIGLWTVCLHPNTMEDKDFDVFSDALSTRRYKFTDVREIKVPNRGKRILDRALALYFSFKFGNI